MTMHDDFDELRRALTDLRAAMWADRYAAVICFAAVWIVMLAVVLAWRL